MRTIDADALTASLKESADRCRDWIKECINIKDDVTQRVAEQSLLTFNECYLRIKKMPTVEPQRWVPVSERLPENNEEVLTTYIVNGNKNKRYTETATYYDDDEGDWLSPWDEYREAGARIEVVAWMPLPEPWRGGQDETN